MKINIVGSIFGTTGYDSHTRNLANALYKVADVKLTVPLIANWERQVNDAELAMITKQMKEDCITIMITTPHNWKLYTGLGINIGYCVWEGDKVPQGYIEEFLNPNIDLIFVPSEHTKKAILNTLCGSKLNKVFKMSDGIENAASIIDRKIVVIPHGVDKTLFYPKEKTNTKFTFLCNKGWRGTNWDRGGVQYVLKAFAEEFKKDENVQLTLKLNPAYMDSNVLNQSITNMNLPKDRANINICLEAIPFDKLNNFYADGDVYVCATRSEAFDLGTAEAMACGLPIITSGYGGQIEHMIENKNALFFDYELENVTQDLMYEGIKWCLPKIEDIKKKMRQMFENKKETKQMGENAYKFIGDKFTWEISANKIIKSIKSFYDK